jgi:predicted phosphodiesterase
MKNKKPVLVIGDTHAPCMHPNYLSFLKKIYKKHKCGRVVHIGDLVDWCSISYHDKEAFMPNPVDEFKEAQKQVKAIHKAFPKADLLIGNHDSLPSRKAASLGLPDEVIRDFDRLWQLDGWTIHDRYSDLVIDDVIYRHGDKGKGGVMAGYKNAIAEFKSVVQGHLHAQSGIVYHANGGDCVFGMQVGCGVDHHHPAMNYGRVYAAKPILSCGVVYSSKVAFVEPMFL